MNFKKLILGNNTLKSMVLPVHKLWKDYNRSTECKNLLKTYSKPGRIFYLGIPVHTNLGDLAQGVCIRRWIKKHYPGRDIVEIETNALVNTKFSVLDQLKKVYTDDDIIVFQSGYTTTDLGGYADEMHRAVMNAIPNARMLMLPQTIYFKEAKNKKRTSLCYNSMKHMLFLARDRISYQTALEMFPDVSIALYPDIVTTMIGNYRYNYERSGIMFCCRNDGEKYYSDEDLNELMQRCAAFASVKKSDTTKNGKTRDIVLNAEKYILEEIDEYAHYKVIITDRYHGTILSLVAGTPVIIIKTTDHKVITGAEWFNGIYDDYVYLAEDLEHAYELAKVIYEKQLSHELAPYFEKEYYDKLPALFDEKVK